MSQTTTYVPQAGTIPAKVIAHLQTLPPGAELSTAMVLEAIGQPAGWHGLTACLKTAVDHGVISKRQDRGGWMMWGLVDPAAAKPAAHAGQGVDIDRAHAKPSPLADHTAIDDSAPGYRPRPKTSEESQVIGSATSDPDLLDVVDAEFVEVAISNTGRLLISTGIQQIALSPEQTQKVFQYLDEQRGIEWEAA